MSGNISSIDDLLATQSAPSIPKISEDMGHDESHDNVPEDTENKVHEQDFIDKDEEGEQDSYEDNLKNSDTDEYGNKKGAPRTYTEEEVNERINKAVRERLARERKHASVPHQADVQKEIMDNFEHDPDSADSWQKQLADFVKQTVNGMQKEQEMLQQREREAYAHQEFERKFHAGMAKFADFADVVGGHPITDAMVIATRGMTDPAAFLYAASKRAPESLLKISKIADPTAQIAAMGALEAQLKKQGSPTKAPRPMSRTIDDGEFVHREQKEDTIEDLIQKSEAKKMARMSRVRGR